MHNDLLEIPSRYIEREKCGFWVAILLESGNAQNSSSSKDYAFINEDKDTRTNDVESSLFPNEKALIGTLAIDIKEGKHVLILYYMIMHMINQCLKVFGFASLLQIVSSIADPDMKEPPNSVALLKRMAVSTQHQRKGVGSAMIDAALNHCIANKFRAVELTTTEHHEAARNLYAQKGFELAACYQKKFVFGLVSLNLYRLRVPCAILIKNSQNNANNSSYGKDNEN